jgi:polysaccharide pyruvyl transferase WcaK-like protein
MYGWDRFRAVYQPKAMALRLGTPLALLPQTYGPYRSARARELAQLAIRSAACAWARDEDSFLVLREILGDSFDPARHRCGVDMAFGLEPRQPARIPDDVADALESDAPLAGVNVSGLLAYLPPRRLALDYLDAMTHLVRALVDAGARVILVPHVHGPEGGPESDLLAAEAIRERLSGVHTSRVLVLPGDLTAHEVKWVISRTDWFCGARMHATIAALSTMTPSIACAYSDKFAGVFASAGMRDAVVDLRDVTADELLSQALTSFHRREESRSILRDTVPAVVAQARGQMGEIISSVVGSSGQVTT